MSNDHMNPITEDDIANYLANSPGFFERHAELLASVMLTSPHGNRAVSLQERQAEMLREKIKALEHRIMDMVRHGNENMIISDRIHRWAKSLLLVQSTRALPATLVSELQSQFMVPQVALKVWDVDPLRAGPVRAGRERGCPDLRLVADAAVLRRALGHRGGALARRARRRDVHRAGAAAAGRHERRRAGLRHAGAGLA